jgi:hypothetical protein
MQVLIGAKSSNLAGGNILSSQNRKGNYPLGLRVRGTPRANSNWDLAIAWYPPRNKRNVVVSYSVEYQKVPGSTTWTALPTNGNLTRSVLDIAPDAYKVRVRANYGSFSSVWVESQSFNAFINLFFTLNDPYHGLII